MGGSLNRVDLPGVQKGARLAATVTVNLPSYALGISSSIGFSSINEPPKTSVGDGLGEGKREIFCLNSIRHLIPVSSIREAVIINQRRLSSGNRDYQR